jgi:hypothetical protein
MRARRRNTELTPHLTPIAVRTPRALSSSATACNFITPLALISAMMGASSIACASAFTSRVWGPTRRFGKSRSPVVRRPTPLVLQCCVAFAENSLAAPRFQGSTLPVARSGSDRIGAPLGCSARDAGTVPSRPVWANGRPARHRSMTRVSRPMEISNKSPPGTTDLAAGWSVAPGRGVLLSSERSPSVRSCLR